MNKNFYLIVHSPVIVRNKEDIVGKLNTQIV